MIYSSFILCGHFQMNFSRFWRNPWPAQAFYVLGEMENQGGETRRGRRWSFFFGWGWLGRTNQGELRWAKVEEVGTGHDWPAWIWNVNDPREIGAMAYTLSKRGVLRGRFKEFGL